MFIKIGIRKNLLYPLLFILFLFLRRVIKLILEEEFLSNKKKTTFIMLVLIYFFQFIIGLINLYQDKKSEKQEEEKKINGIELIQSVINLEAPDSNIKIILLIFFSAYFELIGALTRRYLTQDLEKDRYDEYHAKFRSLEICLSSMLSSLTLNIKIHKHQSFSLIIIVICLLIVFILDFITEEKIHFLKNIGSVFISSICRVYLDTIEKYLFEVDFVEFYKLMAFESIFNFIFISLLYFFEKPRKEFENLCNTDFLKIFFIFFY